MSQVLIFAIKSYQLLLSPLLQTATGPFAGCRYEISCSAYAIEQIQSRGVIRGIYSAIHRILSCL